MSAVPVGTTDTATFTLSDPPTNSTPDGDYTYNWEQGDWSFTSNFGAGSAYGTFSTWSADGESRVHVYGAFYDGPELYLDYVFSPAASIDAYGLPTDAFAPLSGSGGSFYFGNADEAFFTLTGYSRAQTSPVPEPGSSAAIGGALAFVAGVWIRRRRTILVRDGR